MSDPKPRKRGNQEAAASSSAPQGSSSEKTPTNGNAKRDVDGDGATAVNMEAQDEQEAGWSPGGVSMFSSYTATGSIIDELSPTKFLGGQGYTEGEHQAEEKAALIDPDHAAAQKRAQSTWLRLGHFMETNPWVNYFLLFCIAASTVAFCVETVHSLAVYKDAWYWIDFFFVFVFSVEYILRFLGRDESACSFIWSPMNVIDLLAIVPFYAELALYLLLIIFKVKEDAYDVEHLRALRCLRLARMFKFGRYSSELEIVSLSFARSFASFLMLAMMLCMALVFFSTAMYVVERGSWDEKLGCYRRFSPGKEDSGRFTGYGGWVDQACSPYQSIPMSFWWCITTMTTVGYGDTYPVSDMGKVVGGCCMIVGILCVALPTTVLGVQFSESYEIVTEERKVRSLMKAVPTAEKRQEAFVREVQIFRESREKLAKIQEDLASVMPNFTDAKHRDKLMIEVGMFQNSVDLCAQNIDDLLHNSLNPAGARVRGMTKMLEDDRKKASGSQ